MKEFVINEQQVNQLIAILGDAPGKVALPVAEILRFQLKLFVPTDNTENQGVPPDA